MEEVYLNGKRLDLEERSISRTLQINNFREVQDRQANYSNNISIPMTSNNIEVLDFLGFNGNTSNKPFQTNNVKYRHDGIELISEGRAIVKKTKKKDKSYDLVIYDGAVSLQELLGDATLQDLDLTAYNHDLSVSNWLASLSNTSGYTYSNLGLINVTLERTIPLLFVHTIFDLIFTQKGWTYEWSEFNTADFQERVFTMDKGFDLNLVLDENNLVHQDSFFGSEQRTENFFLIDTFVLGTYTSTSDTYVDISFEGGFNVFKGFIGLIIELDGTLIFETDNISPIISETVKAYLQVGSVLEIKVQATSQESTIGTFEYNFNYNFTVFIYSDNSYYSIDFNAIIGDMKQIDFIKDVMQRYNLSFVKARNINKFIFMTSEELLNSKDTAEDWSDKLSEEIDEDYQNPYGQINRFSYIYDDNSNDFADGIMNLTNTNLVIEKSVLKSIFKATVFGNGYQMNYWSENGEPIQDGNRIFRIVKLTNEFIQIRLQLTDNFSDLTVPTLNTVDFDYLFYQKEIDRNYPTFRNVVNKFRVKRFQFNLDLFDIYNVNFLRLKYLKQTGKYYYLNKIASFKKGKLTTVELIEL